MKCIENLNVPICRNCVHFKPSTSGVEYGRCSQFGRKNIVTGDIYIDYADFCRNNESLCGKEGKLFLQETRGRLILRNTTRSIYFIPFGMVIGLIVLKITY